MVGYFSARARAVAGAAVLAAVLVGTGSSAASAAGCDATATPASLSGAVAGASAGQTICLAAGSYGTWAGTGKAITLKATPGTATMKVNLGPGDSGFTLDGLSGMGGDINAGARNVTIRNSSFTDQLDVEGATLNVLLDSDHFDWNAVSTNGGINSKLFVDTSGTLTAPALTVRSSTFRNGDLDGIHVGGGSGLQVVGNQFENLCDRNVNHTDNLQFEGGSQIRIAGNYVYAGQSCATQGLTSYDGDTNGVIIEDNVIDIPRDWGIELYSDKNSIVRHNTVVYHPKSYSEFNTGTGQIDIDRKSQDPAGSGTEVYDNIATVSVANGSTADRNDHNLNGPLVLYLGPTDQWAGFKLALGSLGIKAADDGLDLGARIP